MVGVYRGTDDGVSRVGVLTIVDMHVVAFSISGNQIGEAGAVAVAGATGFPMLKKLS